MSVLEEVLIEEYDRSSRILCALEEENKTLPRGSIRRRLVRGREYYYLQYREGIHVRSKYVKKAELEHLQQNLKRRRENEEAIKELNKSLKQIIKALDKEYINDHTSA
jgi:hypothetical protein